MDEVARRLSLLSDPALYHTAAASTGLEAFLAAASLLALWVLGRKAESLHGGKSAESLPLFPLPFFLNYAQRQFLLV